MNNRYATGSPSPAFRDLEEQRISPDEYAKRTRREVQELIRESPPPRRHEGGAEKDQPKR